MPRQRPRIYKEYTKTFRDHRGTLTDKQIKKETERCLSCGVARVDKNLCIGCGLCTTRCKFDAITLTKEYDAWGLQYEDLLTTLGGIIAKETEQGK
jgi:ferredoxin